MVQCELRRTSDNETSDGRQAPFGEFTNQIVEKLVALAISVGDQFEELGRLYAEREKEPLHASSFRYVMDGVNNSELASEYTKYIQKRYMDGYCTVKAAE